MSTEIAAAFHRGLDNLKHALAAVSPSLADVPWRDGGWTRKQILGHMLDSATNNRQRFVRASTQTSYEGPTYAQDTWVAAHGYADQDWSTLLSWWQVEHEILAAIVDRIPQHQMTVPCLVEGEPLVTLQFLIEDYIDHQQHHLRQIQAL